MNNKFMCAVLIWAITSIVFVKEDYACGTVEGWVEVYFDKNNTMKDDALYMIHCEPVLPYFYKATPTQHLLIAKMINHALKSHVQCYQNLAIKNFFIFDKLFQLRDMPIYVDIVSQIERTIGRNIDTIEGYLSFFNFVDTPRYCSVVQNEINQIRDFGRSSIIGEGKRIVPFEVLDNRLRQIKLFKSRTNKDLNVSDNNSDEYPVLAVSAKVLKLRAKPATKSSVVKKLIKGELIRVIKTNKYGWYQVIDIHGSKGWVAGQFTSESLFSEMIERQKYEY